MTGTAAPPPYNGIFMLKLRGVFCPLATPFDACGEIRWAKLRDNLARFGLTELSGYLVASRDGEGETLSEAERERLWEAVRDAAGEKILLAAARAEGVRQAVESARAAADLGYAAILVEPPGTPEEGSRQRTFFQALADAAPLPVWIDQASPATISAGALVAAAAHPNVRGMRWMGRADEIPEGLGEDPERFALTAGREAVFLDLWERGARAGIFAAANVVPFHLLSIEEALRTRETEAARELIERLIPFAELTAARRPAAVLKHAMDLKGRHGGPPRLPDAPLDAAARAAVEAALKGLAG